MNGISILEGSGTFKVLSFDPGEKNFAYSITEHKIVSGDLVSRCLLNGILESTITNLKDQSIFTSQVASFIAEIDNLRATYDVLYVGLERFMGRGIKVGTTSETTNIMIGLMTSHYRSKFNDELILVNPATWKNAYNKIRNNAMIISDLKEEYKLISTTPHQFDASLIGIYIAAIYSRMSPFYAYKDQYTLGKLMLSIERTSKIPLIKRKKAREF